VVRLSTGHEIFFFVKDSKPVMGRNRSPRYMDTISTSLKG